MSTQSATLPEIASPVATRAAAPPRFRLQLTPAERKFLLVFGDLAALNGSLIAALTIWERFVPSPANILNAGKYFLTLSILWLAVAAVFDLYNLARAASTTAIAGSVAGAALLTALVYTFVPWFTPALSHRSYVFGFVGFSLLTSVAWRFVYARALVQPGFSRRALILGDGEAARALAGELATGQHSGRANPFRGTGYEVLGLVAPGPVEASAGENPPILGDLSQLVSLAHERSVDEIVVATDPGRPLTPEMFDALLDCREMGLQVSSPSAVHERFSARLPVDYARSDLDIILDASDGAGARLYAAEKRLLDVLLALAGLAVFAVVAPLVALGNALTAPGALFYYQERAGKGGCPFKVIKFRSMRTDAESAGGAVWCGDGDPRITPLGRWLRKLRLDELPQVINVLRGEMSVVGPRPERPQFVGEIARQIPLYRARHAVKPGITGWAQIHYGYGDCVEDARIKLEYDLYYVKHASLYLDILTILQTIAVVLQLKGK